MNEEKIQLIIVGNLDKSLFSDYKETLGCECLTEGEILSFCDYSKYEIPVGYNFNAIKDWEGNVVFNGPIVLEKISQEFFKPYYSIPKGHKTICKFKFLGNEIPKDITSLPVIKDWYESTKYLIFQ